MLASLIHRALFSPPLFAADVWTLDNPDLLQSTADDDGSDGDVRALLVHHDPSAAAASASTALLAIIITFGSSSSSELRIFTSDDNTAWLQSYSATAPASSDFGCSLAIGYQGTAATVAVGACSEGAGQQGRLRLYTRTSE